MNPLDGSFAWAQSQAFLGDPHRSISLPSNALTWGNLQSDVLLLCQNYLNIKQLQQDGFHAQQVQNLKAQMKSLRQLQRVHSRKKELNTEALNNTAASYQIDQKLFAEGIYSRTEFQKKENDYLSKKREQEDYTENVPVKGIGKACVGQKVVLKLDDYPFQEFGTVEGKVMSMAPSTDVKTYRMVVALTNGLKSSYHQDFICKSEMSGTAEIITVDMRLFERAFYGIRKLVM